MNLCLKVSSEEQPTTNLCNLFHCQITFTIKNLFLMSQLDSPLPLPHLALEEKAVIEAKPGSWDWDQLDRPCTSQFRSGHPAILSLIKQALINKTITQAEAMLFYPQIFDPVPCFTVFRAGSTPSKFTAKHLPVVCWAPALPWLHLGTTVVEIK